MTDMPLFDGADEPDAWDYCPLHETHFPAGDGFDCPECLAEREDTWDPDDVISLGPEPRDDGWYLDMLARAAFPGHGWRD